MKKTALYVCLILSFLTNNCYAQNSIFAGKIVDQNNRPVPGAVIKVSRHDMPPIEAVSDSDGLYCTRQIPDGSYYLDVFTEGKYRGENELSIDTSVGSKKFFLIKVHSKKFAVSALDKDMAMEAKLRTAKQENKDGVAVPEVNGGTYMFMLKKDTSEVKIDTTRQPTEVKKPIKTQKRRR
jgi:hypothetical protein